MIMGRPNRGVQWRPRRVGALALAVTVVVAVAASTATATGTASNKWPSLKEIHVLNQSAHWASVCCLVFLCVSARISLHGAGNFHSKEDHKIADSDRVEWALGTRDATASWMEASFCCCCCRSVCVSGTLESL